MVLPSDRLKDCAMRSRLETNDVNPKGEDPLEEGIGSGLNQIRAQPYGGT